jgi:hypothetical protein
MAGPPTLRHQGISPTVGAKAPILLATLPSYAVLWMLGREVGGRERGEAARRSLRPACTAWGPQAQGPSRPA